MNSCLETIKEFKNSKFPPTKPMAELSTSGVLSSASKWIDDDDEPFTEEDLEAIEAIFESVSKKPRRDQDLVNGRRLPNSIVALQHPDSFSLSPCQANLKMRYPEMTFRGQITYSRTEVEVERAAMELLKTIESKKNSVNLPAIGFDIEWRASFRKGALPGKAAVMQICLETSHCHVMHIIHSGIPKSLRLLLENSMLPKVGIGIGNDAVKVFKDYNVSVNSVEDLSCLANQKLGGYPQKWSLASLTENLVSKQLPKPKNIRLGNWEAKVLSKDQLHYAATDAFTSWYLYEVLRSLPDLEKVATNETSEEVKNVLPKLARP